jgi:hypothetical protein
VLYQDYYFYLTAFNIEKTSPIARFMPTQIGQLPSTVTNVQANQLNPTTVNVSWDFTMSPGEAITKWFVITATPTIGQPITFKSCHGSERSRNLIKLNPAIYTITVQAVNDVGYSFITDESTTVIIVN